MSLTPEDYLKEGPRAPLQSELDTKKLNYQNLKS